MRGSTRPVASILTLLPPMSTHEDARRRIRRRCASRRPAVRDARAAVRPPARLSRGARRVMASRAPRFRRRAHLAVPRLARLRTPRVRRGPRARSAPRLARERPVSRADAVERRRRRAPRDRAARHAHPHGADQLVELDLERVGVAVLRALDQEHHQEGDDRRAGVDHELPRVAEAEQRPADRPQEDHEQRGAERRRPPGDVRRRTWRDGRSGTATAARSSSGSGPRGRGGQDRSAPRSPPARARGFPGSRCSAAARRPRRSRRAPRRSIAERSQPRVVAVLEMMQPRLVVDAVGDLQEEREVLRAQVEPSRPGRGSRSCAREEARPPRTDGARGRRSAVPRGDADRDRRFGAAARPQRGLAPVRLRPSHAGGGAAARRRAMPAIDAPAASPSAATRRCGGAPRARSTRARA